mgnify:CR=1 FL=1
MTRFPVEKYASLELNQVAFPKTGMVVSQTPLGSDFNNIPCENGMWVVADKSAGALNAPSANKHSPIGIVYTTEKEYDSYNVGLKNYSMSNYKGTYPRVGIFGLGDTVTTNCLQYDETTYATFAALETVLKAANTTPVYVVPVQGSPVPQLTATKPNAGTFYGVVTKYYTVPNGEKGVKYQIVSLGN